MGLLSCGRVRFVVSLSLLAASVYWFVAGARGLAQQEKKPTLELKPGDHVSILGNTLADRMQHDGWLETYLYARFPKHNLVFRNLGFSGDELTTRLRSSNFGSPDQWLTKTQTDVIFAFFGYNESFAGQAGLEKFKADLDNFVKNTLKQKYNGQTAPRLVLFSPIAHENLGDRNLPDGSANNKRLALYTAAMAEVAKANQVPFVDLFKASQELYSKDEKPLTINGVHLNEHGNQQIALAIDAALFPKGPMPTRDAAHLAQLRQAVVDKNFVWFNRYRTVDGYSIYGGRAGLKFVAGQTNKDVMDREMEILDEMTANRDRAIWQVASGAKVAPVDDSNTKPFIPVTTNKPGPLPGGKHLFLDGTEAIEKMKVGQNLKVNLFASEKEFPDLVNPVQMSFDTQGRLWVATWPTYPHWKPKSPMNDKLLIFEDTNGDGKADKMTVFADNLHCPTGFEFYNGGVLVAQAPDLVFLKDTDGDGKADQRVRVLSGIDSADTHHTANSFVLDPGGALYFQEGTFHHTQVETPWGPPARCANAGVFRYEPRTHKFDVYVNFGFANPHGHVFDRWGQDFVVDGTGANPYHATLFSGQTDFPQRHGRPPQLYKQKTRPCPGMEILSSRHFPPEWQGNLLVANVIGFHGILRYKINDKGASFEGVEQEPILSSTDPNFRPSDLRIGPDGAIYFLDWHNPIIGHMQHNLRDPSRDVEHGRIYRVTYVDRPMLKPVKIAGEPIEKLLDLLKQPEDRVRYRARIELGGRKSEEVVAALEKWVAKLDPKDAEYEHHMMEALWQHQYHNIVNEALLKRMLRSPDFRARAAATKVLCYWRDLPPFASGGTGKLALELLRTQINDSHPRVRLEAIRALSFFHGEGALAIALELLASPDDEYLRFTFNETLNTLEKRVGSGKVDRTNIASSLLKLLDKGSVAPERVPVLLETITRHGSPAELKAVWERVAKKGALTPAVRRQILEMLVEAALTRKAVPDVPSNAVRQLLGESSGDTILEPAVLHLIAAWKLKDRSPEVKLIALDNYTHPDTRAAAIEALGALGERNTLESLAGPRNAPPLRFLAAVALAKIDLAAGAEAAAKALASSTEKDDPAGLVEAFLQRKQGPETLAAALARQKITADVAKGILRAMFLAGRNDPPLAGIASKFAGLDVAAKTPSAEEIRQLGTLALQQGDPAKGERVFRRADLGCLKCHSLNKAGGDIGPDLGPIGGSSPMDYIVQSILDPNASIKEEYLTKVIATGSGRIVTGIVVERTKNQVTLKDATGKLVKIPTSDIEEEANGKTLMPEGVTRILTKGELLDLIRFVAELGKPGSAFGLRTTPTIQRWKRLRDVPATLVDGIPNRDVLRDTLLQSAPAAWDSVYSLVTGTLPLDEVAGKRKVLYLQGEINVVQQGPIEFALTSSVPAVFWVDEEPFEKQSRAVLNLAPGRHVITVRVVVGDNPGPTLKLELLKPAKSKAGFEVVHGGY